MPRNTPRSGIVDKIIEAVCRLGALAFAAVYTQVHSSERAPALRVAELAYRFLRGESADSINADADAANKLREEHGKKAPFKKRSTNHGQSHR